MVDQTREESRRIVICFLDNVLLGLLVCMILGRFLGPCPLQ